MQESGIFTTALKLPPAERSAYLDRACGANAALRLEVEGLLLAHEQPGEFMERPPIADATTALGPGPERPGQRIGPYKLLQFLGEGGMGTVFLAEQTEPVRRMVALKIIKSGMDSSQVLARFEAERQALAIMDHPNIAKVLDAGTIQEADSNASPARPYFVMELVKGVPITEYCDKNKLTTHERLDLFIPVCNAIQHAHMKGIIHRDIKPSNVLIALYDGKPVAKVIDFGVAKAMAEPLTQRTLFTQVGQIVGTFEYMSPEQATLNQLDIDTRSDIYSLGVLLYELLTGVTPIDKERLRTLAFDQMLRAIREEEPMRPSMRLSSEAGALANAAAYRSSDSQKLAGQLRGELDWIVMKCLEKERERRFITAGSLAQDIGRYLRDEPVEACPPSLGYRMRKAYRRNRAAILGAGAIAATLVIATAVSIGFAVAADDARRAAQTAEGDASRDRDAAITAEKDATKQRDEARIANANLRLIQDQIRLNQYAWDMQAVPLAWEAGHLEHTWKLLDRQGPKLRGFDWHYWDRQTRGDVRSHDLQVPIKLPNGMWAFSDDGALLAHVSGPPPSGKFDILPTLDVWDVATRKKRFTHAMVGKDVKLPNTYRHYHVAVSPNGKRVAALRPGLDKGVKPGLNAMSRFHIQVLDSVTGKVLLNDEPMDFVLPPTINLKTWFSPDGRKFALYGAPSGQGKTRGVRVWDVDGGKDPLTITCDRTADWPFSPDGKRIVLGRGKTGKLIAFDTTTGAEAQSWEFAGQWHENSPDGTLVASVDIDRALEPNKKERHKTLHIWDAASSKKLFSFALSPLVGTDSFGLFFNRDGKRLTFISKLDDEADELFIFDPVAGKRLGKVMRPAPTVHSERADRRLPPVFSRDGSQLVIPSGNGMTIWDVATGKLLRNLRGHVSDVEAWCLLPDGQRMLSVELGGTLKDWDLTETKPTYLPVTGDLARFSISAKIAVSADGSVVAFFDRKLREDDPESPPSVSVWDVATGKAKALVPDPRPESVKSARDILTCQLAVSDNNCRVALARKWMQASGIEKNFFERDSDKDHAAVSVFDLASGKPIWQQFFPESSSAGNAVLALAPDGARVAVALKKPRKDEYDIKVIDVDTARERVIPVVHGSLNSMRFSPDGRRLATLVADTAIKAKRVSSQLTVWDLATLKPVFTVTTPMGGGPIAWSRDGACLALVPFMYDAATGKGLGNLEALDQGLGTVNDLVFSPDGLRIAGTIEAPRLVKSGPLVKVWDAATGKELLLLQPTRRVEASGRDACCVAFSADGHRLLHFDYWQRQKENAVVVTTWDATPRELVEPRTQRGHGP